MRVVYTQTIDGVQHDEPQTVEPPIEGDDPTTILQRKADGAKGKGWKIKWRLDGKAFTATKRYPRSSSYKEKVRTFELIED